MKLAAIALVLIIVSQQASVGLSERAQHIRTSVKKLRRNVVAAKSQDAGSTQQQQQQRWQPNFAPALTDLTGSFSGTWTRLPDYDSGSSSGRRPPTAMDADAAAALASQRLEDSGWPPILTRALSGRLLLKLHSGPANPQGVAGVEGVLSVSEGALVLGPALKRLALSGFTRIDPDNNQGVYAVMSPQAPIRIAPPDYPASPIQVGRSTLSVPQQQQQHASHTQQQKQQHAQVQQGSQQQQQQHQEPGQQSRGWLASLQRARSSQGSSTFSQQLSWILRSSAGDDAPTAFAAAQSSHPSSGQGGMGECKFRLELTVTRADDFWVASAATNRAAAAAAAAVPPRAAMHSLHQKIGQSPAMQQAQVPQPEYSQQQQQQQQQQHKHMSAGYVLHPNGPIVDTASKNFWGLSWQQYFGVEEQQQEQQQEEEELEEDGEQSPDSVPVRGRSAMEVPPPTGYNTVLQIPLGPVGSPSIGILDEYDVAADAEYAAGYEAGYAAAAAEAEAAATAAAAAAEAARNAAAAIAALPRQYQAHIGSAQGSARALKARDIPGMDKLMLSGAAAASGWQPPVTRSMIEQAQAYPSAPAAAPAEVSGLPSSTAPAPASEAPSDTDSSSRYGVRNLFDAWLLPCSHPKQRDTQACRQQMLTSGLHPSSSSSSRALEYSSSRQQQPRLHIQGLLISDNCQARWALSAVALPPGGLEVQALWYALLALLVCLVQVMLLRRQASVVTRSSAVALRVSLVGVCAGAQIDAFLSMAHLAASMSSPDISMPLLVVAAAQFALFAGADMTLLLHVWRAHDHHHQQQQRYQRQFTADTEEPAVTATVTAGSNQRTRDRSSTTSGPRTAADTVAAYSPQWLAVGTHMGPFYRPHNFMGLWAVPVLVVVASARQIVARIRWLCSGGRGSVGLLDRIVLGIEQLATGRSLLMLYIRFYLVLLSATVLSWFMTSQLPLLLLAAFSFWVPQIWHNIINTARQPLQPGYILVSTAARLLLPVYLLCCPMNLLQLTPQPWLAAALLVWVGLQVAVLLLQHFSHPHIILPASWAPVRYNYHRVEVPWQFKQAAAEAAAAAKAEACAAYDPTTQSLTAPTPLEQPAGGGSGHFTCCCTGVSGACHLCSSRRYIMQEAYGNNGSSCTIRFSPRRQSSAAGPNVTGLRTNRAMLATETPLIAVTSRAGNSSGLNPNWRLQTATSAPQQQLQQQVQLAGANVYGAVQAVPCSNCGGKLSISSCNSFCSSSRDMQGSAAGSGGSSRWSTRHMSQQDMHTGQQASYAGVYPSSGVITRSISSAAQLQTQCQHEILPQQQQQQLQQLVLSLPPGTSVELSSSRTGCQHCCQCSSSGSSGGGWSGATSPCTSSSGSTAQQVTESTSDDPLNDVEEGYDAFTGDGVIECVICMAGVRLLPLSERFVTPCGHFFHPECLTSWMEVKAECPQCRGPLPPL